MIIIIIIIITLIIKIKDSQSFKQVYDETRTSVACQMAAATNEWIRVAWRNERLKPERLNITEKGSRESNDKYISDFII